jgi:hypothetical protein
VHQKARKRLVERRVLAALLLAGASSALAQESIPGWTETGDQTEIGRYTVRDNNVTAVLRIEGTRVSVTTLPDDTSADNGHMLVLSGRCGPGELDFRGFANFKKSQKLIYTCPDQPYYSIEFASVKLADYDDTAMDPNMPAPPNEPLFSVSDPEPGDLP